MKTKGFTLIELLVVIVIIGILVAIALPNFIKIKDKAKEAEVKQNLHAIQLAVERYAVDVDGNYPFYLYGGTARANLGTTNGMNAPTTRGNGANIQADAVVHPFDMFWVADPRYDDYDWGEMMDGDVNMSFGDTLQYEGYMVKYPKNPFLLGDTKELFSTDPSWGGTTMSYFFGWGGEEGFHMWNIGWLGDGPYSYYLTANHEMEKVQSEFPGFFFYHPRWSDGITHYGHMSYQQPYHDRDGPGSGKMPESMFHRPSPGLDDQDEVFSLDVAAYNLVATGSARTKGMDIDNSVIWSYGGIGQHLWRTGYFTLGQERNPYVGPGGAEGDYNEYSPNVDDYDERPVSDGWEDFYIIHLSSGLDIKRDDRGTGI